jgi:hypothetical protein
MKYRGKTPTGKSKRMFSRTAGLTHKFNLSPNRNPLRGGTRL